MVWIASKVYQKHYVVVVLGLNTCQVWGKCVYVCLKCFKIWRIRKSFSELIRVRREQHIETENCFCSPIVKNLRHHQQTFEIRIWATIEIKNTNQIEEETMLNLCDGISLYISIMSSNSIKLNRCFVNTSKIIDDFDLIYVLGMIKFDFYQSFNWYY